MPSVLRVKRTGMIRRGGQSMRNIYLAGVSGVCALLSCVARSGTNTWTDTGPNASNVNVAYSANPAIAFARGGDKFYKSSDGGVTWTAKLAQNTERSAYALDPSNANVIVLQWAGFNNLQRSTDAGETFTNVSFALDVDALKFSRDGAFLYALTNFPPYVRRSVNQGASWSNTANTGLPAQPPNSIFVPMPRVIGIHPADANTLYVGFRDAALDGIYKSVDGGANWTVNAGMFGVKVWAVEVSHANPQHVYAASETGLYRTVDGGTTWARVPDPASTGVATASMTSVTFDPANANVIYAGGSQRGEIFRSSDGGATWERRDQGVVASTVNSLSVRPGGGGQLLAGTSHTLYRTANAGQSWAVSAAGIRAANVTFVQNGSRLRAGLADGGLYESLDGNAWTALNNTALRASQTNNLFGQVRSISEPGKLFVMLSGGGLTSSSDGGNTWQPRPPTFNTLNNGTFGGFLTLPGSGLVHLATTTIGVEKSHNDGATWQWSSNGLPNITTGVDLVRNADASEIYLGTFTQGIYKSTDGGDGWMAASGNLQGINLLITALEYDEANNVLVVGTNDGAFVTRDGGANYTPLTHPTPGTQASIRDLLVEDFDNGAIYIGTLPAVYRSVDQGVTWTELSSGTAPSVFDSLYSLAGDGSGVIYAGRVPSGLKVFTVAPDIELLTSAPAAGNYAIGAEVPWSVTVRNNGPHAATFARFEWQVPANVSITNLTTSRGSCSVAPGRLLNCDLGVMQPASVANIALNIRGNSGGTVAIAASAGASEIDSQPGNQSFANSGVRFVEQVDLASTLNTSAASVDSGGNFDYTLSIRNNGPDAVSGASFQTTFDARDQYALAQGSLAGCSGTVAGTLTCPLPALASGASSTWRWTVTPIPAGSRTANAVANVNPAISNDTDPTNNGAAATLNVRAVNDMSLALAGNASSVNRGAQVTYTLTVTNHGVIVAPGVITHLTLPSVLRFVSATGAVCTGDVIVACEHSPLAAGASTVVAITLDTLGSRSAEVTADVTSANPDPNPNNNSANATLTIAPVSDVGVTMVSSAASATQNTQFSYTLTATNSAGSDASAATSRVTLSNLLTFTSSSGATCTHAAGIVTCDLGTLAPGGSLVVTINVSATSTGAASSSAEIQSAAIDPAAANNSSSAPVVTITSPPPPPPPSGGGSSSSSGGGGGGKGGGAFDYASALTLFVFLLWSRERRRRSLISTALAWGRAPWIFQIRVPGAARGSCQWRSSRVFRCPPTSRSGLPPRA